VQLGHTDFRFRPDGSALEPVEGETGTFGHAMTLGGERFFTETSRPARYAMPLPWRYLGRNPDAAMPRVIQDAASDNRTYPISPVHPWRLKRSQDPAWVKFYGEEETTPQGVFTSACSPLIYQDVAWPAGYRGQLFVCDPSQNLVSAWRIEDDGPGLRVCRVALPDTRTAGRCRPRGVSAREVRIVAAVCDRRACRQMIPLQADSFP
jgi:hypothetical protein